MKIHANYIKNPNLFVDHLLSLHKNEISWEYHNRNCKETWNFKEHDWIYERLAYKMTELSAFYDELLQYLSYLNPESFNFANRYTNIRSTDYFKLFYNNLMKFYNHKAIKQKWCDGKAGK